MGNGPRVLHFGAPLCGCCHDVRSTATQSCHVDSPARGGPYHCVSGPQWELGVCVAEKENLKPQMAETRIVMAHSPNQGLRLGFNPISGKFRAWDAENRAIISKCFEAAEWIVEVIAFVI